MKQIIIALSLIILCTQYTLFSMEPDTHTTQQTKTPLSEDEIITIMSNAINVKYSSNNYFSSIANALTAQQLTSPKLLDIMNITAKNCPISIPDTAFNTLYEKNNFFAKAVDYFVMWASKNLELITANNITTIENPKKEQPIHELNQFPLSTKIYLKNLGIENPEKEQPLHELNKLPLPIKTYIMNRALQQIKYTYDIILADQHNDYIETFDVCELTDQAVTSSFNWQSGNSSNQWNSLFILWDLKTGKSIHTFDEPSPINIVAFNPNGSCIAAALYNEKAIKIWCPKTGQSLHKLCSNYTIKSLAYSYPTGSVLTALSGNLVNSSRNAIMTQWTLTTDNKAGELLNISYVFGGREQRSSFAGNKYEATHPSAYLATPQNELHITKKACAPLYLCMQAIQKTNNLKTGQIESSASYHQSTSLEMTKINTEIQRKLTTSQENNKQQPQSNTKHLPK